MSILSTHLKTSGPSSWVSALHTAIRPISTAAQSWSKLACSFERNGMAVNFEILIRTRKKTSLLSPYLDVLDG